jgi:SPASM domain peptide maturase of grasp-with-spasm system
MNQFFKFYPSCILVKGHTSSCIYDLLREKLHPIDNEIYHLLKDLKAKEGDMSQLEQQFGDQFVSVKNLISSLVHANVGYFTDHLSLPDINLNYESPLDLYAITVAIPNNSAEIDTLLTDILALNFNSLHLMFPPGMDITLVTKVLKRLTDSHIRVIELSLHSNPDSLRSQLSLVDLSRVSLVYSLSEFKRKREVIEETHIIYDFELQEDLYQGVKGKNHFVINLKSFSEANNYNMGLNGHIYINQEGDVFNHFGHSKTIGNRHKESLGNLIKTKEIKKSWGHTNDSIETCKDCQFRYCCFDTSEIVIQDNLLYKALACDFNPYNDTWKHG